jgi:hypothetical protein
MIVLITFLSQSLELLKKLVGVNFSRVSIIDLFWIIRMPNVAARKLYINAINIEQIKKTGYQPALFIGSKINFVCNLRPIFPLDQTEMKRSSTRS